MRYLVLSDIHGNLEAFQAVIEDARSRGGWERVLCLGDTVGYGADVVACLDLLRSLDPLAVAGNHDCAAVGRIPTTDFNDVAACAVEWASRRLRPGDAQFLQDLPLTAVEGEVTLVHGSLRDPVWEYLLSAAQAGATFRRSTTPFCLVGHSHVPLLFRESPQGAAPVPFPTDLPVDLSPGRWVLNPGSVGQPRDGDPRASYVVLDTSTMTARSCRVEYDVEAAHRKIVAAGLPAVLGERLRHGW